MLFFALLFACFLWTGIFVWLYIERGGRSRLLYKAMATTGPALVALTGAIIRGTVADWILLTSALCFVAADVYLECKFVKGVLLFLSGHLGILVVIMGRGCSWVTIGVVAFLGAIAVACVYRSKLKKFGKQLPVLMTYVVVLFGMVGAAMSCLLQPGESKAVALITALGSVCFATSDMILGREMIQESRTGSTSWWIMALYELGVLLLVIAPFAAG